ncbi:hypothetical protein HPC49_16315 [Pyxidicoccus fallax]|uniref:Uncharacterized protein n=1 Tax=Pyxidicoccus fallax TaxID=394095 RepID=A0A848LF43_9BACT|nr:hypothetical protein [Pyxidicoccus fallax]NMO17136.1 hypothetical protein [Pyxidicoccus fallax]NPC79783.1 hypothetical protein [Pyxidicoccus fallax]
MSSIRRIISGLSSSISRARLDVDVEPVSPLAPREPLEPVAPVRRGFSDQSEFQAEVDDLDSSLAAHAPSLAGTSSPGGASGASMPQQLRVFSGESSFEGSFESARPRYAQMLGSQLPSSLGAPSEPAGGGVNGVSGRRGTGGVQDMDDLLSPETAAWELHNLDTSPPSAMEAEDVLFMMDPPASKVASKTASEPVMELGLEDVFEEGPASVSGAAGARDLAAVETPDVEAIDDSPLSSAAEYARQEAALLDPAVRPAGPDEFLADPDDLGTLIPEEPSMSDAALSGVLASLAANPAAAAVPVSGALGSQGVEAVAEAVEPDLQAQPSVIVDLGTTPDTFER